MKSYKCFIVFCITTILMFFSCTDKSKITDGNNEGKKSEKTTIGKSGVSDGNNEGKKMGVNLLKKYLIECEGSYYKARPYHDNSTSKDYIQLTQMKNAKVVQFIEQKDLLNEADKLNNWEYRAKIKFYYYGPARFYDSQYQKWSNWNMYTIIEEIKAEKKSGNWSVEFNYPSGNLLEITCNDIPGEYTENHVPEVKTENNRNGVETEADENNINSIGDLNRLELKILSCFRMIGDAYDRRIPIIADILEIVKTQIDFKKESIDTVNEALIKAKQIHFNEKIIDDPKAFSNYLQIQNELTDVIVALLKILEGNQEFMAKQEFRDLQVQLEGTEIRISYERMRYNNQVEAFNFWRLKLNAENSSKEKQFFKAPLF